MMYKITKSFCYGLVLMIMISCSKEEDVTPCAEGRNARVNDECGIAFVSYLRTSGPGEFTEVDIKWASGLAQTAKLTIEDEVPLSEKTYEMNKEASLEFPKASFWFPQLNRRDKMTLTITKIDRVENLMSGRFTIEAEGFDGVTGYEFIAEGTFEDAVIRQ